MKIKLIINMEIIYGKIVKVRIQNGSVIYHFIKIKNIKSKAIETGRHYTYGLEFIIILIIQLQLINNI